SRRCQTLCKGDGCRPVVQLIAHCQQLTWCAIRTAEVAVVEGHHSITCPRQLAAIVDQTTVDGAAEPVRHQHGGVSWLPCGREMPAATYCSGADEGHIESAFRHCIMAAGVTF